MDENRLQNSLPHNILLENRKKLTASCVREVDSFDEQNIVAVTGLGELNISGSNLHINRFSTDEGELVVEGDISSVSYSDNYQPTGNIFSRIFR